MKKKILLAHVYLTFEPIFPVLKPFALIHNFTNSIHKFYSFVYNFVRLKAKTTIYFLIVFALLLWCYNIIKGFLVPFYWDEIYTYMHYVKPGVFLIQDFDKMDANNHLLNTWLIQAFVKIFGAHQFILRLPAILSFLIYALFAIRFSRLFSSTWFQLGSVCILLLNPFVNDYFYLARGYSFSMAMLLGSLYYCYRFLSDQNQLKYATLALLITSLGLLANFSLLNYLLILMLLYGLYISYDFKKKKFNLSEVLHKSPALIIPAAILLFSIPIILKLKNAGALFAGKNNGFWEDTFQSLVQRFLYQPNEYFWVNVAIETGVVLILCTGLIIVFTELKKGRANTSIKFLAFLFLVLSLCIFATAVQHFFMDVLYGYGRTAMYYYPILSLAVLFTLYKLNDFFPRIANGVFISICLVFSINFGVNANITNAIDWQAEGDTKKMVKDLQTQVNTNENYHQSITLGMAFPYHDDLLFYKEMYNLPWLNFVQYEYAFNSLNDYFFIPVKDTVQLKNIKYKILSTYAASESVLIQNKQTWATQNVFEELLDFESDGSGGKTDEQAYKSKYSIKVDTLNCYSPGFTYNVDTMIMNANVEIVFSGKFYYDEINEKAKMVISFERNGQAYLWQARTIKDDSVKNRHWKDMQISSYTSAKMKPGDQLKCYIWNSSPMPVYVDNLACSIVRFSKVNLNHKH